MPEAAQTNSGAPGSRSHTPAEGRKTTGGPARTSGRIPAEDRLIFALDVPTTSEARKFIQSVEGTVHFFKIGIELYAGGGLELIPSLIGAGNKVFLDLKYYDVPETVKRAVRRVASLGVSFLTIHGNGKIIRAAAEGRGDSQLKLLSVTALTSMDREDMEEMGFSCSVEDLVMRRAESAKKAGCDGVIASPREATEVRRRTGEDFLIVTPGIRPADRSLDDHKRSGTPEEAIHNGADYLVVGRPIRNAPDPRKAAAAILAEIERALDHRQPKLKSI